MSLSRWGAADASCLKGYMARRSTRFEHTAEITAAYGYRDSAAVETELAQWGEVQPDHHDRRS